MSIGFDSNLRDSISLAADVAGAPVSSVSCYIADTVPDAVWRLRVEVYSTDGKWAYVGAVDTVAPNNLPAGKFMTRLVFVASSPGATNWRVTPTLVSGAPPQPNQVVRADMGFSTNDELTSGCCVLAPVPTISTTVASRS